MYYKLSKDEYLEKELKFKKTYAGKKIFEARILFEIIGCIFWWGAGFSIGYNSTDVLQVGIIDVVFIFMGALCELSSVLWHIEYRRELKDYINQEK